MDELIGHYVKVTFMNKEEIGMDLQAVIMDVNGHPIAIKSTIGLYPWENIMLIQKVG